MANPTLPVRLLAGVAAGLAGTFVPQGLLAGSGRWAPETLRPIRRDSAEFMVEQAESALPAARRAQVPPKGKAAAEKGLQLGYGARSTRCREWRRDCSSGSTTRRARSWPSIGLGSRGPVSFRNVGPDSGTRSPD